MTQVTAGEKKLLGLGRYRFRERLSTSFFGGRTFCGTDVPPPPATVTPGQPASWCSSANPLKDRDFYSFTVSYSF